MCFCEDICFYIDWLNAEEQDFWVVRVLYAVSSFSDMVVPLYISVSSVQELQLFHSFVNASYCHFYQKAILIAILFNCGFHLNIPDE